MVTRKRNYSRIDTTLTASKLVKTDADKKQVSSSYDDSDLAGAITHPTTDGKSHSDVVLNNIHRINDGSQHAFIDQDVTITGSPTFDAVKFVTSGIPAHTEGLMFYDNVNKTLAFYNDEVDSTLQIGQEIWIRVYNSTGSTITNGQVCYLNGVTSGFPTVALAKADAASTSFATIGIATHDIETGSYGYITTIGTIRDIDTSLCASGDPMYLSSTTAGGITDTPPGSPNFLVRLGTCMVSDASVGTMDVHVTIGNNNAGVIGIFNGAILEQDDVSVSSDGADITLSIEKLGGGDLSLFFQDTFTIFDSTPAATIVLTAGTDTVPVLNYVYIPQSTNVLTKSTSSFPTTGEYAPIATVICQTAASAQTDGVYKLHAWSDHIKDDQGMGHIVHVNSWIRQQNATWDNGVAPTTSITANGGAIDNVYHSNTTGEVYQLHKHTYPAQDMSTSDVAFVVNDFTTSYDRITDLSSIDTDSAGVTLRGNNTYYSLVIWGVISEDTGDCQIMVNAPDGSYGSEAALLADASGYSNYVIPSAFKGVGFLIARISLRYQTITSGTITEVETLDLRGLFPSSTVGGAGGASTSHNNLPGLQGGTVDQYYHETLLQNNAVVSLAAMTYVSDSFIKVTAQNEFTIRTIEETKQDLGVGAGGYIDQAGGTSDTYGTLTGLINGSNALYTVSQSEYVSGTLRVSLNGQLQTQGTGEDWVETTPGSGTFTFAVAPPTGSIITVVYGSEAFSGLDSWAGSTNITTLGTITACTLSTGVIIPAEYSVAVSDESTNLTVGTTKVTFRMPYAMTVTEVRSNVNTAPTGSGIIVDINESGTSILSTKLTIDTTEKTSVTASIPAVISDGALADDSEITIDIDQVGSTIAGKGLKLTLIGTRVI